MRNIWVYPLLLSKGRRQTYIKEQVGREVLIKEVIQAIPTYAMGCFKLPVGLCHEIETLIKKFFWGQRGNKRKMH